MAELPEYKRREQFQPATPTTSGFQKAAEAQASAGNLMSSLGSQIAQSANIARSEQAGIEYGKNPSGNLLPALNESDKAFQQAYRSSAQATLNLKGQALLNDGIKTISQAQKITPQLIDSFKTSMSKGIDQISELAPNQDKRAVNLNLKSSLLNYESSINDKFATQIKKEVVGEFRANAETSSEQIQNTAATSGREAAEKIYDNHVKWLKENRENGIIATDDELKKLMDSARIDILSGVEINETAKAIDDGTIEKDLKKYGEGPKEGMTHSEWIAVGQNKLQYVQFRDNLDAKNNALLGSEMSLKIQQKRMTQSDLQRFEDEMPAAQFNTKFAEYVKSLSRDRDNTEKVNYALQNYANTNALSNVDKDTLNAAHKAQSQQIQKSFGLDEFSADTIAAASAGKPIPAFIGKLNANALSGNPQTLEMTSKAVKQINVQNPGNLTGLTDKAQDMLDSYDVARSAGQDIVTAHKTAQDDVLNVDSAKREAREAGWKELEKKVLKNGSKTWGDIAKTDLDLGKDTIVDKNALGVMYKNDLRAASISKGNIEAAKIGTKRTIMNSHSVSKANGKDEFVYRGLEKDLNIDSSQLPFVYTQIAQQVGKQIDVYNNLPNTGFRYELLPVKDVNAEEYDKANKELKEELLPYLVGTTNKKEYPQNMSARQIAAEKSNRLAELKSIINSYEQPGLPQVKRIDKESGLSETYSMNVYATDNTDQKGMTVYNVTLRDASGIRENFVGANAVMGGGVFFVPNKEQFDKDYMKYIDNSASGDAHSVRVMQKRMDTAAKNQETKVRRRVQHHEKFKENINKRKEIKIETATQGEEPLDIMSNFGN